MSSASHLTAATSPGDLEIEQPGRIDPTSTTTAQRNYARLLRDAFGHLNADVDTLIVELDALGLADDSTGRWAGLSDAEKLRRFEVWFEEAAQAEVLDRHDEPRVREQFENAAQTAVRQANRDLRQAAERSARVGTISRSEQRTLRDRLISPGDAPDVFEADIDRHLEEARGRVRRLTDDFRADSRSFVAAGLATGISRSDLSGQIVSRGKNYKNFATAQASGDIVNTYNTTKVTSYENVRADIELETEIEHVDAGDDRVCDICLDASAREWTLEEVQQEQPIPWHDNCRCQWVVTDVRSVF